jgi:two-component system chemotaxis response regulator CheB
MVAQRLNERCAIEVREAAQGDDVCPGVALIAPGDYHMTLVAHGSGYKVQLNQKPPVQFVRPSVDVLFASAAQCTGHHAIGVILTGMGADGALGMKKLKEVGGRTLAQEESTCVVAGMPHAAREAGGVDRMVPLNKISSAILSLLATPHRVTARAA